MKPSHRRYEILVPRLSGDGTEMPRRTLTELRERFGAVSCEMQAIRGEWAQGETIHRDELVRVFIDVEDTPENRQFFLDFRETLKARYQQLDVWITSHPIEVL